VLSRSAAKAPQDPPRSFDKSPLSIAGDDRGVLCLHGITGTPFEVRPFAEAFGRAGFSVEAPLLAGHGETLRELARVTWGDWLASAERKLDELQERTNGRLVAICGFSMGGLPALRLAQLFPTRVAALVVMGTPLRLRRFQVNAIRAICRLPVDFRRWSAASIPKPNGSDISIPEMRHGNPGLPAFPIAALRQLFELMDVVRAGLPNVHAPALVVHARHDHVVPMDDSLELTGSIGSEIIERLWLERSFHVVGLDVESADVVEAATRFVGRFVGSPSGP
jgi:carboxylesterase